MAVWNNHGYLFTRQTPRSTFNECDMCGVSKLARADWTFIAAWKTSARSFLLILFFMVSVYRKDVVQRMRWWVSSCLTPLWRQCHWMSLWLSVTDIELSCLLVESEWTPPHDEPLVWCYVTGCSKEKKKLDPVRNKVISREHWLDFEIFSAATLQSLVPLSDRGLVRGSFSSSFASRSHFLSVNSYCHRVWRCPSWVWFTQNV